MKKPIFENEEEAINFYNAIICEFATTTKGCFLSGLTENGYIKKSIVEESEEMYKEWSESNALDKTLMCETLHKQSNAIQYLKKQMES